MSYQLTADDLKKLADAQEKLKATERELRDRMATLEQRMTAGPDGGTEGFDGRRGDPLTGLAEAIAKDARFSAFIKGETQSYGAALNMRDLFVKATVTTADTAQSQRVPGAVAVDPGRTRWVRSLIPTSIATAANVEFVKETNARQDAEPQYDSPSREGVAKAESTYTFQAVSIPVVTLAHFAQTSRQIAADVPSLAQFIGQRLLAGVEHALEANIIAGDGTNGEMEGLLDSSNYTAATGIATADNELDMLRRGIAQLQATNHTPDAILLNPADHADIEILRESSGPYLAGDPRGQSAPTLWGVPVYVSPAVGSGTYVVAALRQASMLWVREEAVLRVSDSHASTFTSNVLTWLAEARFAFAVTRPSGVIVGSF